MAIETVTTRNRFVSTLQAVVLAVAALYFGRPILMPLALSVLLTFLLKPVVSALERCGCHRGIAVSVVVVLILGVFSVLGWQVGAQLTDLAEKLPAYRSHLRTKLADLRGSGRFFQNIRDTVDAVSEPPIEKSQNEKTPGEKTQTEKTQNEKSGDKIKSAARVIRTEADRIEKTAEAIKKRGGPEEPRSVRVIPQTESPLDVLKVLVDSLGEFAATTAVVVVLVIFMLIEYEELRNRLVRLAGTSRMTVTTRTLDEAGKRIGRYLLMNAIVNGAFGLTIGLGLYLIGIDYAPLWGVLAAGFRFVPYVGPIAAFVMPFCLALIQYAGWTAPALVAALFLVVELITNTVIEPLTYGKSAGVSTVALLISATFWTWVWGPIGLILSVPMTVVLVVLGKYISSMEPLEILLGDAPALPPYASYYQRLLAGDLEEAAEILEESLQAQPLVHVYDSFVIPALALAERDHNQGELAAAEKEVVWQTTRNLIQENVLSKQADSNAPAVATDAGSPQRNGTQPHTIYVAGCPAFDMADELALTMLQHLLPDRVELQAMPVAMLASEVLAAFEERMPDAVWVSALGPGGVGQTRYLCKRIHQIHPHLRIFVGRWGFHGDKERMIASLKARGASEVVLTMQEACDLLQRVQPLQAAPAEPVQETIAPIPARDPIVVSA